MRVVLLGLIVTGCTGEIEPLGRGGGGGPGNAIGPDAGSQQADAGTATSGDAAMFACRDRVTAGLSSGEHNPGQDCLSGCHDHGFSLAGTMYTTAAGGAAVPGATITITDAAGQSFDIVSQQNGNFYTARSVTFPVTVVASMCPDVRPMVSQIAADGGGCNKSGCHQAAGAGRVHVP